MLFSKAAGIVEEPAKRLSVMGARAEDLAQHLIESLADQFGFGDAEGFGLALEGAVLLLGDVELLPDHEKVSTSYTLYEQRERLQRGCERRIIFMFDKDSYHTFATWKNSNHAPTT